MDRTINPARASGSANSRRVGGPCGLGGRAARVVAEGRAGHGVREVTRHHVTGFLWCGLSPPDDKILKRSDSDFDLKI